MTLKPKSNFNGIDISEIRKMNALAKKDTINLGIGQLPNDLPGSVKEMGIKAFSEGVTRYTSNQGMIELTVQGTEADEDSTPSEAGMHIEEFNDRFNDFSALTGWIEE